MSDEKKRGLLAPFFVIVPRRVNKILNKSAARYSSLPGLLLQRGGHVRLNGDCDFLFHSCNIWFVANIRNYRASSTTQRANATV